MQRFPHALVATIQGGPDRLDFANVLFTMGSEQKTPTYAMFILKEPLGQAREVFVLITEISRTKTNQASSWSFKGFINHLTREKIGEEIGQEVYGTYNIYTRRGNITLKRTK